MSPCVKLILLHAFMENEMGLTFNQHQLEFEERLVSKLFFNGVKKVINCFQNGIDRIGKTF
jgi:hypothetical protein